MIRQNQWILLLKESIHESRIYSNPIRFRCLDAAQRNGETVFAQPRVVDAEFPSEYLLYVSCRHVTSVSCLCTNLSNQFVFVSELFVHIF